MTSYKPIPLYDEIVWNLITESCHILLLALSGAGKSMFLSYLAGMVLKRGHNLLMIDAKKTALGETYKSIGVPVASETNEIIKILTELVEAMEDDYKNYFSSDEVSLDTNFATPHLPAHVLIFDEVLSALESGDKKQKTEMERLLKLLALNGRMAGYIVVLTSQRLLATDLPKSVTEQCQTRIIMGANVSDELFHVAMGVYKKDIVTDYDGDVGKGYILTPKNGLTAFKAPYMDFSNIDFRSLMYELRKGGATYGPSY
ncbi:ATP-binding protein [Leuconostoc mesenteroides]